MVVFPQDDLDYPLGKLRFPPLTEPAQPLRLVDLNLGFVDESFTAPLIWDGFADIRARWKLNSSAYFGGEVRGSDKRVFFNTQRLEFGVTQQEGIYGLNGLYRAGFFRVGLGADKRKNDTWLVDANGALRLNGDLEVLLRYEHDTDQSRGGFPSVADFKDTGRLPELGLPTRILRSAGFGVFYQRGNHLELEASSSFDSVRTEAGFDQKRQRAEGSGVWNNRGLEIDGRAEVSRITGRLARLETLVEIGAAFRISNHFVATARTKQEWHSGVERTLHDMRGGVTFYARNFNFARSSEFADELLKLIRRVNKLGYNERRVYDAAGLRALRERLSISSASKELSDAIRKLYRAEIRERDVPQLGVEVARTGNEVLGAYTTSYRILVGLPWHLAWPFTSGEERVDFLRVDWTLDDINYPLSLKRETLSHRLQITAELNREHLLRVRWDDARRTSKHLALSIQPVRRIRFDYIYALGR